MATRFVIPPGIGRAAREALKSIGMTDQEINDAVARADGLKEADMTPANYPCLNNLASQQQRTAFNQTLRNQLLAAGSPVPTSGMYSMLQAGVAAEDLNATLAYLQSPGFLPWKALVNLLRFIKTAGEGRTY